MSRSFSVLIGALVLVLVTGAAAAANFANSSSHVPTRPHLNPFLRAELHEQQGQSSSPDSGWMTLAPLPAAVEGHCTASVGNKIYAAYGFSGGDSNQLRIYDIASNTWSLGPAAPLPVRSEGYRGVAHDGALYCVGGRSPAPGGPPLASVERFDPSTDSWTVLASMPDARAGTTAAVFDNSIFVFGGRKSGTPCAGLTVTPGVTTTVLRYDIDTNTWSNAGNLFVSRSDATAARVGDLIFIFGGCNGPVFFSSVEVYNPKTQTSTLLSASMPGGARADAAAATADRFIHIVGGWMPAGPAVVLNHLVFDSHSGTFAVATPMPTHCTPPTDRAELELVSHGDRVYAVGGSCPAFGASQNNVDVLKLA